MPLPSPRLQRGPGERFAAWAVTGPLGHLWSVIADLAVFTGRSLLSQRSVRGAGRRSSARR